MTTSTYNFTDYNPNVVVDVIDNQNGKKYTIAIGKLTSSLVLDLSPFNYNNLKSLGNWSNGDIGFNVCFWLFQKDEKGNTSFDLDVKVSTKEVADNYLKKPIKKADNKKMNVFDSLLGGLPQGYYTEEGKYVKFS